MKYNPDKILPDPRLTTQLQVMGENKTSTIKSLWSDILTFVLTFFQYGIFYNSFLIFIDDICFQNYSFHQRGTNHFK